MWSFERIILMVLRVVVFVVWVAINIFFLDLAASLSCQPLICDLADYNLYIKVPFCVLCSIISTLVFHVTAASISVFAEDVRSLSHRMYHQFEVYQLQQEMDNVLAQWNQLGALNVNQFNVNHLHLQQHMHNVLAHANQLGLLQQHQQQFLQQQQQLLQQLQQQGQNVAVAG